MRKRTQIFLTITAFTLLLVGYLFFQGLDLMTIEDHYGDDQEFFFKSRPGDIVVNRTLKEIRQLEKSKYRIFFIENADTMDLYHWLAYNKIEVYRPKTDIRKVRSITLEYAEELIKKNDLKLIIKN